MTDSFTRTKRVEFAETDLAGVMHFANYFRWMEETEHEMFRSIGLSVVHEHDGATISWPRVSVGCDYLGPARFEDEIDVCIQIAGIGEKSITYHARFTCGGRDLAKGTVVMVCCQMKDGHFSSIPIPDFMREKFQSISNA